MSPRTLGEPDAASSPPPGLSSGRNDSGEHAVRASADGRLARAFGGVPIIGQNAPMPEIDQSREIDEADEHEPSAATTAGEPGPPMGESRPPRPFADEERLQDWIARAEKSGIQQLEDFSLRLRRYAV